MLVVGAVSKNGIAKGKSKKIANQYLIRFKEGKRKFIKNKPLSNDLDKPLLEIVNFLFKMENWI